MPAKKDQDRADEVNVKVDPNAPAAMPASTFEGHRNPAKFNPNTAYQLAGVWYAADGRVLTDKEAQQAHRAMDARAAAARARAILGENT